MLLAGRRNSSNDTWPKGPRRILCIVAGIVCTSEVASLFLCCSASRRKPPDQDKRFKAKRAEQYTPCCPFNICLLHQIHLPV
jgi:hypothetical protein